jgi:hypothetical protein
LGKGQGYFSIPLIVWGLLAKGIRAVFSAKKQLSKTAVDGFVPLATRREIDRRTSLETCVSASWLRNGFNTWVCYLLDMATMNRCEHPRFLISQRRG